MIPYSKHFIDDTDIESVIKVLRSDWLTTGPSVEAFEKEISSYVNASHAVAVSSGTAALHAAMYAMEIGCGDEAILPPITFAATANCVVYQGGTPVFADIEPDTLLLDPAEVKKKITDRTKAIIAVDYGGQPCDYDELRQIADDNDILLVADSCHSFGVEYKGRMVGRLADLTVFSFHPVKHITTGEGGMVVTESDRFAERIQRFRNHGISADHHDRMKHGTWYYEISDLGFNYRITDFQCALGLSQLKKLPDWIQKRTQIAAIYDEALKKINGIKPLTVRKDVKHAYHLYVVAIDERMDRKMVFEKLREKGFGVNVHYIPVHLHPYYRRKYGTHKGMCPISEAAYDRIMSLPMFPKMTETDIQSTLHAVETVMKSK